MIRRTVTLLSTVLLSGALTACSADLEVSSITSVPQDRPSATTSVGTDSELPALPEESVRSDGGGAPRSPGYWLIWNTCTDGNQSDVAIANGGAAEGWYLMDDIIGASGVSVGDYIIDSCAQGANVLALSFQFQFNRAEDAAYVLASRLLAADLNRNIGAESCPAI